MRISRLISAALIFCSPTAIPARSQGHDAGADGDVKIIEVSAKKYDFSPSEIRVKAGAKVRLVVHSIDEVHGARISVYPEGSKDKSTPGLIFEHPEQNGVVDKSKDKDQILEFLAAKEGTYDFKCAKICGMGHGRMKGKLIVEP
jgi:cytochrome c oxidase subunit 2